MLNTFKKLVFVGFLAAPVTVFAGPFGLEMGMSLSDLNGEFSDIGEGNYVFEKVPNTHSAFESYVLKFGPDAGLCMVRAIGKNIETNGHGFALRSAFDDMHQRLSGAYGEGEKTDLLSPGTIWDEPRDYMMSLRRKDRILFSLWEEDTGANLRDNIEQVGLIGSALSASVGYISVEYVFENYDTCVSEIRGLQDSAL